MLFRKIILFLALFFALFSNAQYIISEKYISGTSLDSNAILEMHMDSRQFLWITTKYGVYLKDMGNIKLLPLFVKAKFNNVHDIFEDSQNNMWFGSYSRGIALFNGKKIKIFNQKNGLISNFVYKIIEHDGKIYAGGINGVSVIDLSTHQIKKIYAKSQNKHRLEIINFMEVENRLFAVSKLNGVFEIKNNTLQLINNPGRIYNSYYFKNYMVISNDNGVSFGEYADFLTGKVNEINYKLPVFWDYAKINDSKYWIASHDIISSQGDIYEYDGKRIKSITEELNLGSIIPNRIVFDPHNKIVYVSDLGRGVIRFVMNSPFKHLRTDNAFIDCIEHSNNVDYLITSNGLYQDKNKKPKLLVSKEKFWDIYKAENGKFQSIIKQKQYVLDVNHYLKFKDVKFQRIVIASNSIWVSSNMGLFEINAKGEILNYYPIQVQYFTFYKGNLVDSYPNGGIKIYTNLDRLEFTYHFEELDINPSSINSIANNTKALFFGSSFEGVFKYEDGRFTSYIENGQFKERNIQLIKGLSNNRLLVATEFGDVSIFKIDGEKLHLIRKIPKEKINSININFIEEIGEKIIIGSSTNIVIIDGEKYYFINNKQSLNYQTLTASAVNGENLLVGTESGYYLINIDRFCEMKVVSPRVLITGLQINDHKLGLDKFLWFDLINKNIHIPYTSNNTNFSIDFSLVNPKYSTKYKYRYRLNSNEEWSEDFYNEKIILNSLKHGNYNIQLEVTSLIGGNTTILQLLTFKIDPPFYFHPFFIFCLILVIILIVFRYNRLKFKRIREVNELKIDRIEEVNKEYNQRIVLEKKISEVRLMALQGQMNPHFIFNVLNSIQYYIIDNDVDNALESLNKFARLIRNMLELSRQSQINLKDEIKFLELYVNIENLRHKNKITFDINISDTIDIHNHKIPPMLLQPLVENCFVHAFPQFSEHNLIQLSIQKEENCLKITISDNGKGMEVSNRKDKFYESKGIEIIKERLELFNGKDNGNLSYESSENGTTVTILVSSFD